LPFGARGSGNYTPSCDDTLYNLRSSMIIIINADNYSKIMTVKYEYKSVDFPE